MAINLRNVSKELQQALKVRAATERVTIASLCVRFLWWGLDVVDSGGDSSVVEQRAASPLVAGSIPAPRSKTLTELVDEVMSDPNASVELSKPNSERKRIYKRGDGSLHTDSKEFVSVMRDLAEQGVEVGPDITSPSFNHDPKTCRIYRCGMCAAAKENL